MRIALTKIVYNTNDAAKEVELVEKCAENLRIFFLLYLTATRWNDLKKLINELFYRQCAQKLAVYGVMGPND